MSDAIWKTDDLVWRESGIRIDARPKASDWQVNITPGPYGLIIHPSEGGVPNWFHRQMQRLILGFVWKKKGSK